ncbi:hypothetical protein BH23CHL7_BH23CHL7_06760 [soil metagenome]
MITVSSRANIFGAGHAVAPEPGGGGGGDLPPVVELPSGPDIVVTFPCVTGRISCCSGASESSANGTTDYSTNIFSYQGISGISHGRRSVFLVGVFVGDEEPTHPATASLDFTQTCPDVCTVDQFEPEIGQIFFIGLGGERPAYVAPGGATRLFLGFADAFFTQGSPGWYGNNSGQLEVVVRLP